MTRILVCALMLTFAVSGAEAKSKFKCPPGQVTGPNGHGCVPVRPPVPPVPPNPPHRH
jgi:hypothetical protein